MIFLKRRPSAAISMFVDYLWLLSDAPPHAKERILPTGTMELVINLHHDEIRIYGDAGVCQPFSGTVISGAYNRPFEIDTAAHARMMGVHFRPGGASPFIRVAPGELANAHFDVATLWGSHASQLRERLCRAVTHQDRFDVLDGTLVARAAESAGPSSRSALTRALPRLMHSRETVGEIVSSLGISHRHFAALFRQEVGMTPKVFARIQRFQNAIAAGREGGNADFARLASECGYFDQSHMNRDFAAFAQITPSEYLRQQSERTKDHHVALR
jgi:AraC-like DNA-binding protein